MEPPAYFTNKLRDVKVEEMSGALIRSEVSSLGGTVQWLFNGKAILMNKHYQAIAVGNQRTLLVSNCEKSDAVRYFYFLILPYYKTFVFQGTYTCRTETDKCSAKLVVVDAKLRFVTKLYNTSFTLNATAKLKVQFNKKCKKVVWSVDGIKINENRKRSIKITNGVYNQTIN